MNLPNEVLDLVNAQANHDSAAFADCFSENAVVFDEGKTHKGKAEIKHWISEANNKYNTIIKPLKYTHCETTGVLLAEISGTFEGSPLILNYNFVFRDGLIQSLKIGG